MEQPVKYYRNPDEPISLEDLKSFLWGAATRLRGQIDAAGYKEYIFPLLFFKRISDVYDEQFEGYVCEGGYTYYWLYSSREKSTSTKILKMLL